MRDIVRDLKTFSRVEVESPVRFLLTTFAVENTLLRIRRDRTYRDGLAPEVDVAVAIARERTVSQFNDVAVLYCIDTGLNRGEITRSIRTNGVCLPKN